MEDENRLTGLRRIALQAKRTEIPGRPLLSAFPLPPPFPPKGNSRERMNLGSRVSEPHRSALTGRARAPHVQ